MGTYRIVSFDGGGVRGVLSARLLDRLLEDSGDLIEKSDLIAGCSAGSYIALGLADGRTTKEIVQLLEESASEIFGNPNWLPYIEPRYSNDRLIEFVDRVFGDKKLAELQKRVVVPSFSVDDEKNGHWRPLFFHNFPGSETGDVYVKDVALASSAAPTYFPSYKKMIDGGVIANNPSTIGVAFAVSDWGGHQNLEDIAVLSVGTGFFPYQITQDTSKWGDLQWLGLPLFYSPDSPHNPSEPIIDVLFDGVSTADSDLSRMLVRDRYFRLNPTLPTLVNLDDYAKIPDLLKLANATDLTKAKAFIETIFLA